MQPFLSEWPFLRSAQTLVKYRGKREITERTLVIENLVKARGKVKITRRPLAWDRFGEKERKR